MADVSHDPFPRPGFRDRLRARFHGLVASPSFQSWAASFPLTRGVARREGEALFDLVSGFVQSQALWALVKLDVFSDLKVQSLSAQALGLKHGIETRRMELLLRAGVAMGLLKTAGNHFALSRKGAALQGVPGLSAMILHHDVLYRDLADPISVLKGEKETELANFWPYVFAGDMPADQAQTYSQLMSDSQRLVVEDTLRVTNFKESQQLLDVGGGSGAFLARVAQSAPHLQGRVFDLPEVVPHATANFERLGLADRLGAVGGSFLNDALPKGADTISLVRVLYDHTDDTVEHLFDRVFNALEPGGRLIISEPMLGDRTPHRPGDVYFAFYCLAMQTGQARQPQRIAELAMSAGFTEVKRPKMPRPFVTSVVEARKPV